jgi:hypothetical protein
VESSEIFNGFSNLNIDNLKNPALLSLVAPSDRGLLDAGDRFSTPVYCVIPKIHATYIPGPKSFAGYKGEIDSQKAKTTVNFGINRRKEVEKVDNQEGHSFSQGEKVIALHNSMTTSMEKYKAQLESKKSGSSSNDSITCGIDGKNIHSPTAMHNNDDPLQGTRKEKELHESSLNRCLKSLASEDKLVGRAINYKDKVEQYKRISQLFSDITF